MSDTITKALLGLCTALLSVMLALGGWGVKKVYDVDLRCTRIETKLDIWTTPLAPGGQGASYNAVLLVGEDPYQRLQYAQRAMVAAYNAVKGGADVAAMKYLRSGLEETGLRCEETKDRLECR